MSMAEAETEDVRRFHIDTDWFEQHGLSFLDIAQARMCDACRERVGEEVEERQPIFDDFKAFQKDK